MSVTGDFQGLGRLRGQAAYLSTTGARGDLCRVLAEQADKLIKDEFRDSRDPYGKPWKPLTSRVGKPLADTTTHLLSTLGPRSSPDGFTVTTAFIGAAVHQYGATIRPVRAKALAFKTRGAPMKSNKRGKLSATVFAQEVTIPQRQYMPEGDVGPIWRPALERAADDFVRSVMQDDLRRGA